MNTTILIVGLLLAAKHFVADGPLQVPYQYLNKGKFGHPGGLIHAGIHGLLTMLVLAAFTSASFWIALAEAVAHYLIDYCKTRYSSPTWQTRDEAGLHIKSEWYFYALVLDQSAHFACYVVILSILPL